MFQLIYMRFTQPRADPIVFAVQTSQMKTLMANQANTPGFAFGEALAGIMGQNHPRRRLPTPATIDQWNLDKSMAFYKDRFADASDFTFVFVGNFDLATMKPLVERYLGQPAVDPPQGDLEGRRGAHADRRHHQAGRERDRAEEPGGDHLHRAVRLTRQDQRVAIRAMTEILQTRLLETIREDLGGTYSISASPAYSGIPMPDVLDLDRLRLRSQAPRRSRRAGLPGDRAVQDRRPDRRSRSTDEREALLRDFETSSKQNGYIIAQLLGRYQNNETRPEIWAVPDYYRKIDAATIQQAAKTYLERRQPRAGDAGAGSQVADEVEALG